MDNSHHGRWNKSGKTWNAKDRAAEASTTQDTVMSEPAGSAQYSPPPPGQAYQIDIESTTTNQQRSWLQGTLDTLCRMNRLGALPCPNNFILFGEPEKLDNPLVTAFIVLCRVRNAWTDMKHFHTYTPYLDRIFPPAVVGSNSDTAVSAVINELDQYEMNKFFEALNERFRPTKDQDSRAEDRQCRFFHDSSAYLWRQEDLQYCGAGASAVRKNQEVLHKRFSEMFPTMWDNLAKMNNDKHDVGLFDSLHAGGYNESIKMIKDFWKVDMTGKDDRSSKGKYNRAKYFNGDSAGSALTEEEQFSRSRVDLVHMLILSDMCGRTKTKGPKDISILTQEVKAKVNRFLDLIAPLPRHQKFHIGFGDEKLHGVKGFDADSREIWDMYVSRAESILNPAGIWGLQAKEDGWHFSRGPEFTQDTCQILHDVPESFYFWQAVEAVAEEAVTGDPGRWQRDFGYTEELAMKEYQPSTLPEIFDRARDTIVLDSKFKVARRSAQVGKNYQPALGEHPLDHIPDADGNVVARDELPLQRLRPATPPPVPVASEPVGSAQLPQPPPPPLPFPDRVDPYDGDSPLLPNWQREDLPRPTPPKAPPKASEPAGSAQQSSHSPGSPSPIPERPPAPPIPDSARWNTDFAGSMVPPVPSAPPTAEDLINMAAVEPPPPPAPKSPHNPLAHSVHVFDTEYATKTLKEAEDMESIYDERKNLSPKDRKFGWNVINRIEVVACAMAKFFGVSRTPVGCVFEGRLLPTDDIYDDLNDALGGKAHYSGFHDSTTGTQTTSQYELPCYSRPFDNTSNVFSVPDTKHLFNWPLVSDPAGSASNPLQLGVCLEAMLVFNPCTLMSGNIMDWHVALVGKFISPVPQYVKFTKTGVTFTSNHVFVILATDHQCYATLAQDSHVAVKAFVGSMSRGAEKSGDGNKLNVMDKHLEGEFAFSCPEGVREVGVRACLGDPVRSAQNDSCYLFKNIEFSNECAFDEDFSFSSLKDDPQLNGSSIMTAHFNVLEHLLARAENPIFAPYVGIMGPLEKFFDDEDALSKVTEFSPMWFVVCSIVQFYQHNYILTRCTTCGLAF